MKNPAKFLSLLLTEWRWASLQPQICKRLVLAKSTAGGDVFLAELLRALICHHGDWQAAARWLDLHRPQFFDRVTKFKKWAAKITAPKKRGLLLEWKGGAA